MASLLCGRLVVWLNTPFVVWVRGGVTSLLCGCVVWLFIVWVRDGVAYLSCGCVVM